MSPATIVLNIELITRAAKNPNMTTSTTEYLTVSLMFPTLALRLLLPSFLGSSFAPKSLFGAIPPKAECAIELRPICDWAQPNRFRLGFRNCTLINFAKFSEN